MKVPSLISLLRPKQWIKNLFVFAPLIFSFKLLSLPAIAQSCFAFIIFCLVASAIYTLNDLRDIEIDRQHVKNRFRPLASGTVSFSTGILLLAGLVLLTLILATYTLSANYLSWNFYFFVLLYALINIGYSFGLKHIPLLEMFLVASGYVLRVIAGSIAIIDTPSPWIIMATAVLALLIVAGKRRAEMVSADNGQILRKSIVGYNLAFIDSMISIFGSACIITYMLFTLSTYAVQRYHTPFLIYTSVFVMFGVARYILLIKVSQRAEAPTDLITSDLGIGLTVISWIICLLLIIYL